MKKVVLLSGMACAVAMVGAGCAMCNNPMPQDPSCIEESHLRDTRVRPLSLSKVSPRIVESNRQFRPVFRAGTKVTGTGTGLSEKDALCAAIADILNSQKCDYVVSVNHITTSKTHPTWRFFCTTNYTVTVSGIPIFLDRLVEEDINKNDQVAENCEKTQDGANDASQPLLPPPPIIGAQPEASSCNCPKQAQPPMALIRLTDIKVDVTAKGETADNAGVVFPVK